MIELEVYLVDHDKGMHGSCCRKLISVAKQGIAYNRMETMPSMHLVLVLFLKLSVFPSVAQFRGSWPMGLEFQPAGSY